jgi:hypothetical protein
VKVCLACGQSLGGYRRQARYCGGPCRAAASRARADESRERVAAMVEPSSAQKSAQKRTDDAGGQLATVEQEELIAYLRAKYPDLLESA